ncbi:MAG: hypothetical protein IPN44_04440 [Flavobacteriales bacterium]|nr:hypothetical protein [Flavobacteriales bacterium]
MPRSPRCIAVLLFVAASITFLQAQQLGFTIWKGENLVGAITAIRKHPGANVTYAVSSYSELDFVLKQQVRSTMALEYRAGKPYSGFTSLHLNGSLRDSSSMRTVAGSMDCYVYPKEQFTFNGANAWSTARMYFEEPVGQTSVFVESVMRNCPLIRTEDGVYELNMPGKKTNIYRYKNGVLQAVEVDRVLIKLLFKRA